MSFMRCFLKDAYGRQDEGDSIRNWVSQIRAAAYDPEDVIEIYLQEIEFHKQAKFLKRVVHIFRKLGTLCKVGKEIERIQRKIRDIADGREKLGIKYLGEGSGRRVEELQRLRRSSSSTVDKDVVGLEEKTRFLVSQLLKEEKCRRVVSIIGMGGVGKTTLARKVYNHSDVKARFDCSAWVCVSQDYNVKDILGGIIKQIKTPSTDLLDRLEKLPESYLEKMLCQELKDKCYLIVLDDIWKEEAWDCLVRAFPDGDKSSRLLLTSRNQDVPLHADPLSVQYELKTLGPEDSWQLFLKRAFHDNVHSVSLMELEGLGREIESRCAGLPLAITVIGRLLARRNTLDEWKRVLNSISTHLSRGPVGVSEILALSYNDLPSHLKSCFLYFSFFPKDFEVRTRKLFQLWIAEGLIKQKGTETLEGVAADILDDLISRNMVQVAARSADETVKSCRTHDLLRELAITKAAEEIFLEIDGERDAQVSAEARHLAVHCHSARYTLTNSIPHHVRTLLFFKINPAADVEIDLTSFKLLRVLDLENLLLIHITCLPKEIGEVSLLRYLCLRKTKITKLPSSLGRLRCLQTLDIYNLWQVEVPDVIWKLENLRNRYMQNTRCKLPLKIDTLRNLQTLSVIEFSYLMHNNLLKLTCLQKLGVRIGEGSEVDKLFNSIAELENLQSLALFLKTKNPQSLASSGKAERSHPSSAELENPQSLASSVKAEDSHPSIAELENPQSLAPSVKAENCPSVKAEDSHPSIAELENPQSLAPSVKAENSPTVKAEDSHPSIAELENPQSLAPSVKAENSQPSFVGLSKLCHLTKLRLSGDLTMLPSSHHFPPNLSYLSLEGMYLREDPMPILEKLEQLSVLKLKGAYGGPQIKIQENSFPRLKHFTLSDLDKLEDIALGKGAMPELRCLRIRNCWFLEMLPEELKYMTSLQRFEIMFMGKDFITRIQGVDSYKVCHVPDVIVKDESIHSRW